MEGRLTVRIEKLPWRLKCWNVKEVRCAARRSGICGFKVDHRRCYLDLQVIRSGTRPPQRPLAHLRNEWDKLNQLLFAEAKVVVKTAHRLVLSLGGSH